MRISVFAAESNPKVDRPFIRRSLSYCQQEVTAGRAVKLEDDIRAGIWLVAVGPKAHVSEIRGSAEQRGCLTAAESAMNAQYRGSKKDVASLCREYEDKLDQAIAGGRKGTPLACSVIAAKVKTILSDPALSREVVFA